MSEIGTIFVIAAGIMALCSACAVIMFENPLRSAVALLIHIISLAGLYLTLSAHLLAALQLMVYAGAVVVLFVFVIMLIGPTPVPTTRPQALWTRAFGGGLLAMVVMMLSGVLSRIEMNRPMLSACKPWQGSECDQFGSVHSMATLLYRDAWVPFEMVSVLLVVAIVGAIAVARSRRTEADQEVQEVVP